MDDFIEEASRERRSLEKALNDLLAEYEHHPNPGIKNYWGASGRD
jgi:hypothetical protein